MRQILLLLVIIAVIRAEITYVKNSEANLPCRSGKCLCELTRPECYTDDVYVCDAVIMIGLLGGFGNETISCYLDTVSIAAKCDFTAEILACGM